MAGSGRTVFSSSIAPQTRNGSAQRSELRGGHGNGGTGPSSPLQSVPALLKLTAESLFATLFPADCRVCNQPLTKISRLPVCTFCLLNIHPFTGLQCFLCGELLISRVLPGQPQEPSVLCGICQKVPPTFERAVAFGPYDGVLRDLINLLKYDRVRSAAPVLGGYLAEAIGQIAKDVATDCPLLVPIPLYKGRQSERGFNQTEQIARHAVKQLEFVAEMRTGILVRRRPTESQTGLTRHQRRENVRVAFVVPRESIQPLKGRTVLLVDDVLTTGTTAEECARVLKRAGAAKVWVATVARVSKLEATIGFQGLDAIKNFSAALPHGQE